VTGPDRYIVYTQVCLEVSQEHRACLADIAVVKGLVNQIEARFLLRVSSDGVNKANEDKVVGRQRATLQRCPGAKPPVIMSAGVTPVGLRPPSVAPASTSSFFGSSLIAVALLGHGPLSYIRFQENRGCLSYRAQVCSLPQIVISGSSGISSGFIIRT
jgi:hypothetical protein